MGNITSIEVSEYNSGSDGNYSYKTYSSKNSSGKFIRGSNDWDNFIDVNGEGVGINGEVVGSSGTAPEQQFFGDPFGGIDKIRRYPGGVRVEGWVMDPDTAAPINMDIYSGDGTVKPEQYEGGTLADILRNDLQGIGNGNYHGFIKDFLLEDNIEHNICAYGINAGPNGKTRRFACSCCRNNRRRQT